jgi:hypothetical protein
VSLSKEGGGGYLQVHIPELGKVGADDLVGVHEDDLAQIQEQNLVRPYDPLFVRLQVIHRVLVSPCDGTNNKTPLGTNANDILTHMDPTALPTVSHRLGSILTFCKRNL